MKKDRFNWKILLCCGFFIWFLINLLQGIFTEIHEDEAYYALYGEHLAWGYFDHPPMVGLMTYLSNLFFHGILGVRWMTILFSTLSLGVLWKLVAPEHQDSQKVVLFFALACSVTMLNVYGFVTTPDSALILFSALFLWVYKGYLDHPSWSRALCMGLLMACMVYSKYHALLLLGLIVLSNLKLLKDGRFYVACVLAALLLVPHLLWQVKAGFPSLSYHLVQRSEDFRWAYCLEYVPNQLLVFNPLLFGAMVYVLVKYRADNLFERGLRFIFVGFFFFFWLMAFRGHVEPHWTIAAAIPLLILVYRKCEIDQKLNKYIKIVAIPSLVLMLVMRMAMVTPLSKSFGFYGKEPYYKALEAVVGDCPVAFQGSFQKPALYHYFTEGKPSSPLRSYYDRKTQFDIWQFDQQWLGQRVFVVSSESNLTETYHVGDLEVRGFFAECFQTAHRLDIDFDIVSFQGQSSPPSICPGDTIRMDFSIYNPSNYTIDFQQNQLRMSLCLLFMDTGEGCYCYHEKIGVILPHETYWGHLAAVIPTLKRTGKNRLALCVSDHIATCITAENAQEIVVLEHR